jgi:hypothetical protein
MARNLAAPGRLVRCTTGSALPTEHQSFAEKGRAQAAIMHSRNRF